MIYSQPDEVGYWQPPPGAPTTGGGMAGAWLGFVDPLVSIRPVRLDGPDPLTSLAYAADYQEVLEKGSSSPDPELADEALTARFFAFNPPVMYRTALCELLTASPMGLRDTTGLFATIDTAVATAVIETNRLKFEIGFWRPFQAINDLRDDGNPPRRRSRAGPRWSRTRSTPTTRAATPSATAPFAEVMRKTFGDDVTPDADQPEPGRPRDASPDLHHAVGPRARRAARPDLGRPPLPRRDGATATTSGTRPHDG